MRTFRSLDCLPFALAAASLLARAVLPGEDAASSAIRVILAYLTAGLAPGLLILLLLPRRASLGAWYEIVGLAGTFSLITAQVFCVLALTLHLHIDVFAKALCPVLLVVGLVHMVRRPPVPALGRVQPMAAIGVAAVLVLAVLLYLEGGVAAWQWGTPQPALNWEDTLHIGIAQRLAVTEQPTLLNVFLYPDITYTYPFPGVHYFYALVSRVGGFSDLVFVYDKARFFWWLLSVALCASLAHQMTGRRLIADALPLAFSFFVLSGTLARMPFFFAGQVAPLSHAAVITADVLLPGALVLALRVIMADDVGIRRWALTIGAVGAAAMLIAVHPREVVQLIAYLGCLAVALVFLRGGWAAVARAGLMLVTVAAMLVLYRVWHQDATPALAVVMAEGKVAFDKYVADITGWSLLFPLGSFYSYGMETVTFYGVYGTLLALLPLLMWCYRTQPVMVMAGFSTLAFFVICFVGWISIIVIRLTSDEMLMVPVRNWWLFLRVLLVVVIVDSAVLFAGCWRGRGWRLETARVLPYFRRLAVLPAVQHARGRVAAWSAVFEQDSYIQNGLRRIAPLRTALGKIGLNRIDLGLCAFVALLPAFTYVIYTVRHSAVAGQYWTLVPLLFLLLVSCLAIMVAGLRGRLRAAPPQGEAEDAPTGWWRLALALAAAVALAVWMPENGPLAHLNDIGKLAVPQGRATQLYEGEVSDLLHQGNFPGLTVEGRCVVGDSANYLLSYFPEPFKLKSPRLCYPEAEVVAWLRNNLPPTAVLWVDTYGLFSPQPYVNVRLAAPPTGRAMGLGMRYLDRQMPGIAKAFADIRAAGGTQPILDGVETPEALRGYLREFQITHILVDPAHQPARRRFDATGYLTLLHESGGWAIYAVTDDGSQQ